LFLQLVEVVNCHEEMLRTLSIVLLQALIVGKSAAQVAKPLPALPPIHVHSGGHLLQTADGQPFFWLGDTAWELIDHTTREESQYYLHARAAQGYTVIQTVVLAEFGGITKPSALGEKPFLNDDPSRPNEAYFDHVKEIVTDAAARRLYVALVPIWGDKLTAPWGDGPRLFRLDNLAVAEGYGRYLAHKLRDCTNVVWILGGDRPPRLAGIHSRSLLQRAEAAGFPPDQDWTPIWRAVAKGLAEGSDQKPLVLYHPQGGPDSSSVFLHDEPWLSVNGMQSGHGGGHDVPVWEWIARDYAKSPPKPTLDLEPNYEDHPFNPWPEWNPATGYFRDLDVRKQVYRSVFAGGCGVTYGHHAVWGFVGPRNPVINYADRDWIDALYRPAGRQMTFLRQLIESRPFFTRIPDQQLIADNPSEGALHAVATRGEDGAYAFIYIPLNGESITVDLDRLQPGPLRAWWYDPRTGVGTLIGEIEGNSTRTFRSPPYGPDWVLVLDSVASRFGPPGLQQ
jgi:hypothetical protein